MIKKYVQKPIAIEAVQFTGDNGVWIQQNFCSEFKGTLTMWQDPDKQIKGIIQKEFKCWIETLQGDISVKIGDYVIKGARGQFYCCDKDIFQRNYDLV